MTDLQNEILSLFSARQTVDLATSEGNQPRVRPMTLIFYHQRFFMATSSADAKADQIKNNPLTEIILMLHYDKNNGYVRLSGSMMKVSDNHTKKEIADFSGYIYDYWKDYRDPDYLLLEMIPQEAHLMLPGEMKTKDILWET
jgi:general stress protein 26